MSHGSDDGNTIFLAGPYIAGSRKTGKVACAGHFHARIDTVGAPQGKVHHSPATRRMDATSGFGGDERLKIDLIDNKRLHDLSFDDRRRDFEEGFVCESQTTFGDGPYVAREFQAFQKIKKIVGKQAARVKIVDARGIHCELLKKLQDVLQPGSDEVAPIRRIGADEKAKRRGVQPLALEVGLSHGQLVEIRQ